VAKRKRQQFAELLTFDNVFQPGYFELQEKGFDLQNNWREAYFKNENPLIVELGCGKGEYTVGQAQHFPNNNYIGVDMKGNRIWRGAKTAFESGMKNVGFVRTHIGQINHIFGEQEVDEIWITFPDPQLRDSRAHKRLTCPRYLGYYKKFLKSDGIVHLKTDSREFFDYTLSVIAEEGHELVYHTHDLYNSGYDNEILSIKTHYEQIFLKEGKPINYLKFRLNF